MGDHPGTLINQIVYCLIRYGLYLANVTCKNSVEQARMSPIDFDYLGYFFLRYNEYKKQKPFTLSLVTSYLSASV